MGGSERLDNVDELWRAVTEQGKYLTKVQPGLDTILGVWNRVLAALNAQGKGLREAEARITRLEEALNLSRQALPQRREVQGGQVEVTRFEKEQPALPSGEEEYDEDEEEQDEEDAA